MSIPTEDRAAANAKLVDEFIDMALDIGGRPSDGTDPYGARSTRRSAAQVQNLKDLICEVVSEDPPMTVRQIFYQLVSRGVIGKTENEYKQTVVRLLGSMRRDGSFPWHWIADNTRWMRKPNTHGSLEEMMDDSVRLYRRDLWRSQNAYVEVWLEKEALSGVLYRVTERYDVPLMVTRGYPSLTFLHNAAQTLSCEEKPIFLYYFGDHDPSGLDIQRKVEEDLYEFSGADFEFRRIAVTPEQVEEMNLPVRPTKRTDTRSKNFAGGSVEVDAISPTDLREMCSSCIEQHIDHEILERTQRNEQLEHEALAGFMERIGDLDDLPEAEGESL